jgi:hypothetical protein
VYAELLSVCSDLGNRPNYRSVVSLMCRVTCQAQVSVKRQFESELFLMEDWLSPDDNVKTATMMRMLSLVCGDGACKDNATRSEVATAFVRKQKTLMAQTGNNHITHTSHTRVGPPPHSCLCRKASPCLPR